MGFEVIAKVAAEVAKEAGKETAKETTKPIGKGVINVDARKPFEPQGLKYKDVDVPRERINLDKRVTGIKDKVSEINGYKFVQDKIGRTISSEGKLRLEPDTKRNKSMQLEAGGKDRLKTDSGGHLIGRQFGGIGEKNLVAQDSILNKGPYNRLETKWADAIKNGDKVNVKIEPKYTGKSTRPDSFKVSYSINGEKFKTTFSNKPNAYAK